MSVRFVFFLFLLSACLSLWNFLQNIWEVVIYVGKMKEGSINYKQILERTIRMSFYFFFFCFVLITMNINWSQNNAFVSQLRRIRLTDQQCFHTTWQHILAPFQEQPTYNWEFGLQPWMRVISQPKFTFFFIFCVYVWFTRSQYKTKLVDSK